VLERPQTGSRPAVRALGKPTLEETIAAFWRHHSRRRSPLRSSVARLAELALAPEPEIAAESTRVLFERIIEPLCDGFTRRGAETYRRIFAQIIMAARKRPECRALDEALSAAGFITERDLLRAPSPRPVSELERGRIRKAIVLSRMTLGADVAISLPILLRAEALFPNARIAFVGNDAARVLVRGLERADYVEVPYGRADLLADRLNAWPALMNAVRAECADLAPDEYLLIDPDSRLTQLGLLRPVPDERCFHFPSRSYGAHLTDSLRTLAAKWMSETFGPVPTRDVSLPTEGAGANWVERVKASCAERLLANVSFGVGGNERKRAGLAFEADLVECLVAQGCAVLLARGVGQHELDECQKLCALLAERGVRVVHLPSGDTLPPAADDADVLTWQGSVDTFVASIDCADLYVGYDSAGQHIAAALEVPVLSIFVEAAGRRHALRWMPEGRGIVRVVRSPWPPDRRELLERASAALTELAWEINARRRGSKLGAPQTR